MTFLAPRRRPAPREVTLQSGPSPPVPPPPVPPPVPSLASPLGSLSSQEEVILGDASSAAADDDVGSDGHVTPKGTLMLRAQKRMAGRAATSETGKKLIRKFCPPEVFGVLDALGRITRRDLMAPKDFAKQQEDTLLKHRRPVAKARLGSKVAVMYESGRFKADDFVMSMRLVKRLSAQLIRKWDSIRDPQGTLVEIQRDGSRVEVGWAMRAEDPHDPRHEALVNAGEQLRRELESLLSGHFTAGSTDGLRAVFAHWCDPAAISRVLADGESHKDINTIVNLVRPSVPRQRAPEQGPERQPYVPT